jgi:hypothetical protein
MVVASNDSRAVPPLFSPEFQRNPYPTYRDCLLDPAPRQFVARG